MLAIDGTKIPHAVIHLCKGRVRPFALGYAIVISVGEKLQVAVDNILFGRIFKDKSTGKNVGVLGRVQGFCLKPRALGLETVYRREPPFSASVFSEQNGARKVCLFEICLELWPTNDFIDGCCEAIAMTIGIQCKPFGIFEFIVWVGPTMIVNVLIE